MITIDGNQWPVPCDIERVAEVTPSEISGMMLDKTYFNDVLGTFMRYDVTLAVPPEMADEYESLYDTLTAPVDGHSFIMPHGTGTLEVTARVEAVNDVLVYTVSHRQYWKGIKFTVISNHPSRTMSLGEVLEVGRNPLPEAIQFPIGTLYEVTTEGWQEFETEVGDYYEATAEGLVPYTPPTYTSADEVYF